ncbi:MAG: hypothetical protein LBQ79_03485 [Deltaproteobacteria bacterium]|jgi:hypothetical protein|nr:hypothetical protein [Deltaproteobacteria bacterium]
MRPRIQLAAASAAAALLLSLAQAAFAQDARPADVPETASRADEELSADVPETASRAEGELSAEVPETASRAGEARPGGSPPAPGNREADGMTHVVWSKTFGGTGSDQLESVSATSDGGMIAAGRSTSADGDAEGNQGMSDAWVMKIDRDGTLQWKRSLGGSREDWASAAIEAPFGGYIVAGGTESSDGDFQEGNGEGELKTWAASLDENGETQWLRLILPEREWSADAVIALSGDGIMIAGTGRDNSDAEERCETAPGGPVMIAARTDYDGTVKSSYCRGFPKGPEWPTVALGTDEKAYAAYLAYVEDDAERREPTALEAVGSDGTPLWTAPINGPGTKAPGGIVVAGTGIIGAGSVILTAGEGNWMVPWLFLTGTDGTPHFDAVLEGVPQGRLNSATAAPGMIFAAGGTRRPGTGPADEGTVNMLVIAADAVTGTALWSADLGGSSEDWATDVAVLSDESLVAAGVTDSQDGDLKDRGKNSPGELGGSDGWIVKFRP